MRFAIYSKVYKPKDKPYIQEVFDALHQLDIQPVVYKPYYEQLIEKINLQQKEIAFFETHEDLKNNPPELIITLGGDGTILGVLTLVKNLGIPVAGINLGRLGFLTGIDKNTIAKSMQCLMDKDYRINQRTLIALESDPPIFEGHNFALNDCTILKRDNSSMIIVHTYLDGEFLNSYWADGLIISTPTGSTGYSLSCGGPILYPNSGNFVITPVAPHNLTMRPMVISDDKALSFEIEGRGTHFLCTLDSRFEVITANHKIVVKKANFQINLVRLFEGNFLSTLRNKLGWGLDSRN